MRSRRRIVGPGWTQSDPRPDPLERRIGGGAAHPTRAWSPCSTCRSWRSLRSFGWVRRGRRGRWPRVRSRRASSCDGGPASPRAARVCARQIGPAARGALRDTPGPARHVSWDRPTLTSPRGGSDPGPAGPRGHLTSPQVARGGVTARQGGKVNQARRPGECEPGGGVTSSSDVGASCSRCADRARRQCRPDRRRGHHHPPPRLPDRHQRGADGVRPGTGPTARACQVGDRRARGLCVRIRP